MSLYLPENFRVRVPLPPKVSSFTVSAIDPDALTDLPFFSALTFFTVSLVRIGVRLRIPAPESCSALQVPGSAPAGRPEQLAGGHAVLECELPGHGSDDEVDALVAEEVGTGAGVGRRWAGRTNRPRPTG